MILEVAILQIKPNLSTDFEANFHKAMPLIAAAKGFVDLELQKCLEHDAKYILLVHWEEIQDHTEGFRKSPEYLQWKDLLHAFYDPFPVVEHYGACMQVVSATGRQQTEEP